MRNMNGRARCGKVPDLMLISKCSAMKVKTDVL